MEVSKKQVAAVMDALREAPRGLNVSEASRVTGLNRSTVAKYLEMLYVSGHADMRMFGTAKLYFISQRMPISAFLNFSSDLIIVLDKDSRVMNANDRFFEFTGTRREDIVHKYLDHFAFPLRFNPSIMPYIAGAIEGREAHIESYYPKKDSGNYFNIKLIPLLFDDGEKGVTVIFEDITDKKLAEKALLNANFELEKKVRERTEALEKANEALQESEGRYRALIEKSYDIVYSVKPDGTIVYVSPQIARYGYDPEKLQNTNFFQFIPTTYQGLLAQKFHEATVNGVSPPLEFKFLASDGQEYWAEVTGKVIYDEAHRPLFQVGTVRDIDERKRAEEALRDSELKFKTLFESVSTAILIIDLATRQIVDCNTYATRLAGFTKEELIGMHHAKLHPPESAGPCRQNVRIHSEDGGAMNYETELVHRDGHRIPILINSTALRLHGKKFIIGSYMDIGERKRAEESLRDSEEKFRALADSSKIGILLIQGEETIYANQALADMFGYTVDECLKINYWDPAMPGFKEYIRERGILRQRGEPGPSRNELRMVKKNGELIWLDCTAAMLQYRGKPAMMLTAMDITERKRVGEALRDSEEKFRALVEDIQVLVWAVDENLSCTYVSPKCKDILGYEPAEMIGKTPFDFMPPEELERVMGIVKPSLDAHLPFEVKDYCVIRKDGVKIFLKTNAMPVFGQDGRFKGYKGVNREMVNGK